MQTKFHYVLILLLLLNFGLWSKSFGFSNYLPVIEKGDSEITIKVTTLSRGDDFYLYYKTEGLSHYQVRKMLVNSKGEIYYKLPVENLYGKNLEYFIFEKDKSKIRPLSPVFTITNFTKKESPRIYFMDAGSGSSTPKKRNPFIKISPSYSASLRLYDNMNNQEEPFANDGRLKLYRNIYDGEYQFDFESELTYLDQIGPDESHINLSSMIIRFKKGNHKFEAGDVSMCYTNFTAPMLNRRGLNYEMTGKKVNLNLFSLNSQQKTGFEGFGIPIPDANLFGASTGYKIGQNFKVTTLFITGKDRTDSKTVYSNEDPYREGDIISLWGELKLLKRSLTLKGEIAQSNFGKGESSNDITKEKDTAWKAGFNYYKGKVSASGTFKRIGTDYHSIANLMLLNDREGLNTTIGLTFSKLTWNVTYMDEKNYLNSTEWNKERTKEIKTDVNWTLGNHFSIGGNVGRNNLNYDESTGLQNSGNPMNTTTYQGNIRYFAGRNSISFGIGQIESENFRSNFSTNLSMMLNLGKFLSLTPSASYTSTENLTDNSTSKTLNVTLSSELTFIPEIFTISNYSSYYKSDNVNSQMEIFSTDLSLNFFMAKIFKNKIRPSLSLKSNYKSENNSGVIVDTLTLYLKANISF